MILFRRFRDGFILLIIFLIIGIYPLPPSVTLVFLGDVMLGRGVTRLHANSVSDKFDNGDFFPGKFIVKLSTWEKALSGLSSHLKRADLALANLESPLTGADLVINKRDKSLSFNLCAPAEAYRALSSMGLDVLSLANNHVSDCERFDDTDVRVQVSGEVVTSRILIENGMTPVTDYHIIWREINTLRLAIIALDDVSSPLDVDAAQDVVRIARNSGGLVLVSIHWGDEYSRVPNQRQQMLAHALADAGALIIWGHHPHVLQKVVWLQGNGQPYQTLVAYSLGNALFDQIVSQQVNHSALLKVMVNTYGVRSIQAIPFEIDPNHGRILTADNATKVFVFDRLEMNKLLSQP